MRTVVRAPLHGVLRAALIGLVACVPFAEATPVERPNIVLIIGDDHGWPYYGFAEPDVQFLNTNSGPVSVHAIAQTPNLDTLANAGVLFRNGYTTASVCLPSLRTLLSASGLYPEQWAARKSAMEQTEIGPLALRGGVEHFRTLPRELQRYGYRSWEGGKMWEGTYAQAGFTDGLAEVRLPGLTSIDGVGFGREGWNVPLCGSTKAPGAVCPALDPLRVFLDDVGDDPFFVWFAPLLPHKPWDAPIEYRDELTALGLTAAEAAYLANVRWLDELVGELLGELAVRGLRDDTLIVYLSDNGWGLNLQSVAGSGRGKGTPYDIGSRTPILFSLPGRIPVADLPDLVLATDIPATILRYAQAARTLPDTAGFDLRARIEGGPPIPRVDIVQHDPSDSVYAPPWRYVERADGTEELYRLDLDPLEQTDLAASNPTKVAELRNRADTHRADLSHLPTVAQIAGRMQDRSTGDAIVAGQLRIGDHIVSTDSRGFFSTPPLGVAPHRIRPSRRTGPATWVQNRPLRFIPTGLAGQHLRVNARSRGKPVLAADGRLRGVATSLEDGTPVAGATVKVKAARPSTSVRTLTASDGTWLLEGLPSNIYRVKIKASGFRTALVRDVEVVAGDELVDLTVHLEPK